MRKIIYLSFSLAAALSLAACSSDKDDNEGGNQPQTFQRLVAEHADICGNILRSENDGGKPVLRPTQGRKWPWLYLPQTIGYDGIPTVRLNNMPKDFDETTASNYEHPVVCYGKLTLTGHLANAQDGTQEVIDLYEMDIDSIGDYAEHNIKVASDIELRCKVYSAGDGMHDVPEAYSLTLVGKQQLPDGINNNDTEQASFYAYSWPDGVKWEKGATYLLRGNLYQIREHLRKNEEGTVKLTDYRLDISSAKSTEEP